jgi:hypothetical protein
MFSGKALLKTLIITTTLAGLIFNPKLNFPTAHAAAEQSPNVIFTSEKKGLAVTVSGDAGATSKTRRDISITVLHPKTRQLETWKSWDVVPSLSQTALAIYRRGLSMGNNPHAFSKIGDGEISAAWFLTDFDLGPDFYNLGASKDLETTIGYFAGSFSRQSLAAHRGFNAQRVLDPSLADANFCQINETPLDCEIRLQHPSFALISMGTNQVWQPDLFEIGMRKIIETLIEHGVVPVLSTKADNLEGDGRINSIIARLAVEYDLPVWNFWLAVQALPEHGLQKDYEHLTYYPNDFANPAAMQFAWPVRNLTALQVLEKLMTETR